MFPWLWIYAPRTSWPWSGAVTQGFSLDAFFRAIAPSAGDPDIEHRVFDEASYGKQLGWLTDIVVDAMGHLPPPPPKSDAEDSLKKLRDLHEKIKGIKAEHVTDSANAAIAALNRLKAESLDEFRRVLEPYTRALPSSESSPK
jgi:hypothetical protein